MPQRTRCYSSFHPYFIAEFGRERYIVKPSKVINTPQLHLCWKGNLGMWMPLSQLNDPFLVCLLVCYIRASSQDLSVDTGMTWWGPTQHIGALHCTLKCGPGVCSPVLAMSWPSALPAGGALAGARWCSLTPAVSHQPCYTLQPSMRTKYVISTSSMYSV